MTCLYTSNNAAQAEVINKELTRQARIISNSFGGNVKGKYYYHGRKMKPIQQ